ncbi:MAG TPA: NUDIX hydrolase [Chitinophagales bacterium]|jgi:ADP-ribose pyrophosphatase|nr:NUDIX hydrolase [Chitinophagales bacterium]HQW78789.1 NUDIX hydrolase [Chitinophagales bacterium]HRB66663.1 NUDIX hydrolase [Chitinophagales bacterium]HRB69491.1 NUDIX hydrolase [Chitinophagales bacterium]HRB92145.1 NUDIX hydrolase [Chitinophagales bacterium]
MIDETINPWKTMIKETVYDNNWITVTHEQVITPTGTNGIYGKVHIKNYAIGIIPIDKDGNTWLVGQYRYPLDTYSWEIPEGGGLLHLDILESAKRELKEEVGLIANTWTWLATTHTSNSVTNEKAYLYIAQDLNMTKNEPDETEQLQIKKLPLISAINMVLTGEITDAMSMVALMKLKIWMDEGKFKI